MKIKSNRFIAMLLACVLFITGLGIHVAGNMEAKAGAPELQELTFRDFGLADQAVYGDTVRGTKEPITSWDGVAISGTFTFANNEEAGNSIKFGVDNANEGWDYLFEVRMGMGGCVLLVPEDGNSLKSSSHGQPNWHVIADSPAADREIEFRATFTENEDGDLEVDFTVNYGDEYEPAVFAKEDVAKYSYGMLVTSTTNTITIESTPETSETPEEPELQELTFRDFGLADQAVYGDTVRGTKEPITSWDGVAISGTFTFANNAEAGNSIKFGVDNANEGWDYLFEVRMGMGGFVLLVPEDGNSLKSSSHGQPNWHVIADSPAADREIEFRATFTENEDGDLEVDFTVNYGDEYEPAVFAKEDVAKYSYGMLVTSTTNTITIESTPETSETPEEPELQELTFRDFGLADQAVYGDTVRGTKEPITSWDGVAISGTFTFANYAEAGNSIKFGVDNANEGWDCLFEVKIGFGGPFVLLTSVDALKASSHGDPYWSVIADNPAANTEMEFRATFTENEDGDLEVEFTVNGETTYDPAVFAKEDVAKYSYGMLVTSTTNTITIESTPETSETPEEPEQPEQPEIPGEFIPGPYTEYTFTDFGIYKSTYSNNIVNDWNIDKFDKVAFTGLFTFSKGDEASGIIFAPGIGNWNGLIIRRFYEMIMVENYLNGLHLYIPVTDFGVDTLDNTEIKIRVTFDYYGNNVRMTVCINDNYSTYIDVPKESMESLKTLVLRATETAPLKVASVGGSKVDRDIIAAWKNFLESSVNLKYFGFSNENWKKELAAISQ